MELLWVLVLVPFSWATKTTMCRKQQSLFKGDELVCTNGTVAFFQHFDIPLNKTHWLTCENCTLHNLDETTFRVGRNSLKILRLKNCSIHVVNAHAFLPFPQLIVLNLRLNRIETLHPTAFHHIERLAELDLSQNRLKIITNNQFQKVPRLNLLNLNHNHIFYIQPEAFSNLTHLKYLYLSQNHLTKLEDHTFRHLPNLLLLYLESNRLTAINSLVLTNLNHLHSLYLNNNSISYLVQYNFKALVNLVDLQMRYNNLTEIQTSAFNGLKNLRFLYLGENRLTTIKPYGFIGLTTLQNLDLIRNEFTYFDLAHLKNMIGLKNLWLDRNRLRNLTTNFRADELSNLETLSISNNNLSVIHNYQLLISKMPRLRDIYVVGNKWRCGFLVDLYNFMGNSSVSLCVVPNCDGNITMDYIDQVCFNETLILTKDLSNDVGQNFDYNTDFSSSVHHYYFFTMNLSTCSLLAVGLFIYYM